MKLDAMRLAAASMNGSEKSKREALRAAQIQGVTNLEYLRSHLFFQVAANSEEISVLMNDGNEERLSENLSN